MGSASLDLGPAMSLLEGALGMGLPVLLVAAVFRDWRGLMRHVRIGLLFGLLALALAALDTLFRVRILGLVALLPGARGHAGLPADTAEVAAGLELATRVLFMALGAAWVALLAAGAGAAWERIAPGRPVIGGESAGRGGRWLAAAGLGLGIGFVSALGFYALEVGAGPDLVELLSDFPGLGDQPPAIQTLLGLPTFCSAAISEELAFRGVLLGFLLSLAGRSRRGQALAVFVTTLLWAMLHLSMTDAPLLKLAQITAIGLVLAALTRRWGLGAAILAHLGLNLAGAGTALALTALSAP